jgi:DNA-binding HxlR family transcriptional regulator
MDESCTVSQTVDIIGKKWTILLLLELAKSETESLRFGELRRKFPDITPKMLSLRLKELTHEGLISHNLDSSTIPVKSTYVLTSSGKDFFKVIKHIKQWALKWKVENRLCKSLQCRKCDL